MKLSSRGLILAGILGLMTLTPVFGGTFALVGTGDGVLVLNALAKAYASQYPGETVEVPPSIGSGGGIAAVGSGRAGIARVARELTSNELASGLSYVPLFKVPSVFFVHPDVPFTGLSIDEIAGIFEGRYTNWRQLGGPDLRIRVVRREDADSTVLVLRETLPAFRDLKFTARSKLALTTQEAILSVHENPGAIGFGPMSDLSGWNTRALAIDGVAPTDAAYPAAVTIAVVYKAERLDAAMRRFLGFVREREAEMIMRAHGARPTHR